MSRSSHAKPRSRALAWGLALVVLGIQGLAALNPELTPLDHEELYNAAHARMLQLGHLEALQSLQYRGYCGGCTVNALTGAAIFSVFGPSLWAWKLVPALYSAAAVLFGSGALLERSGRLAALVFAGLFALPPPTWQHLSMVGWGNHMEAGCIAVIATVLLTRALEHEQRRTALALGAVVGLGLWIGFSSGFVALTVGAVLLFHRRWRLLTVVVLGALPVLAIWMVQAQTTSLSIFETIYYPGESIPDPRRIPAKLWSLVAPRQLVALFGHGQSSIGWGLGLAWAAVGGWAWLRAGRGGALHRNAAVMLAGFLAVYSLVRFTVWTPPAPEIAAPGSMRYAAPLIPLLFLIIACGIAAAWRDGQRRRVWLALSPLIAIGLISRWTALSTPFPSTSALATLGPDFPYFRNQAAYRLSPQAHAECTTSDAHAQGVHAYGIGWHQAQAAMERAGEAPLAKLTAPQDLPTRPFFEAIGAALWTALDSGANTDINIMQTAAHRLQAQSPQGQRAALAEFAWRRSDVWLAQLRQGRAHDSTTLQSINTASARFPEPAASALRFALGRRWAHDLARWGQPEHLSLPDTPIPQRGFLEGLAYGLGHQWGPSTDLDTYWPPSTPPSKSAQNAYDSGVRLRWFTPGESP